MKFISCELDNALYGDLIYRESEYSLDFLYSSPKQLKKKSGHQGYMSLTFGTLQIEVGIETKALLYPWGLLSLINLEKQKLEIPEYKEGCIKIEPKEFKLIDGVSFDIPGSNTWKFILDQDSGWLYMGNENSTSQKTSYIEIASGAILGLSDGDISCILIKPEIMN